MLFTTSRGLALATVVSSVSAAFNPSAKNNVAVYWGQGPYQKSLLETCKNPAVDIVNIGFINPSGEWASISGHASIETDRAIVKKHYSPALKAWIGDLGDGKHDGGPEDPRIGIIRVKAKTAQYAVSRRTTVGGFVELAKGIATGEAPSINKLRHIDESEIAQWKAQ